MRLLPRDSMSRFFIPWGIAMALSGAAAVVHAQNTRTCQDIYKEKTRQIQAIYIQQAKSCHGDSACLAQAANDKATCMKQAGKELDECNKLCARDPKKGGITKVNWEEWNKTWDKTLEGLYKKIRPGLLELYKKNYWRFEWKFNVTVYPDGKVEAELDRQSSTWYPNDSAGAKRQFEEMAARLEKDLETISAPFPGSKHPFVKRTPIFSSNRSVKEPSPPIKEMEDKGEDACPAAP